MPSLGLGIMTSRLISLWMSSALLLLWLNYSLPACMPHDFIYLEFNHEHAIELVGSQLCCKMGHGIWTSYRTGWNVRAPVPSTSYQVYKVIGMSPWKPSWISIELNKCGNRNPSTLRGPNKRFIHTLGNCPSRTLSPSLAKSLASESPLVLEPLSAS